MFDLIAKPMGWVMYGLYYLIHDYGLSIILFTLVIKLILFPTSYKQHKGTVRMQSLNPQIAKLKKSFSNNPQRLSQEQNKLYQEEGINPMASCLPAVLNMVILMGVWRVVQSPISHILRLGDQVKDATGLLSEWLKGPAAAELSAEVIKDTDKLLKSRPELVILEYTKSHPDIFSGLDGFVDKVSSFDNSILGLIDLGKVPTLNPEGGWTAAAFALAMIPIASGLFQLALTIYSQYKAKKNNPDAPGMGGMTAMLYIMPAFSVWLAFTLPAGVGFYWTISSMFALLQTVGLYMYFTPKRSAAMIAKEKEKSKKKKPGFYQKMMAEQQAMLEREQRPAGGKQRAVMQRSAGNRVDYSDEDEAEGMSRNELQEYNRQRINEARKRMSEKYGDDS